MRTDSDQQYWQAIAAQVGEHCDLYSAEDLAAFVEGRLRGRNARALAAHVADCAACGEIVAELRRELAPEPVSVRVRFGAPRGWAWALAGSVAAAVLIAIVLFRPGAPGPSQPVGPAPQPPVSIARVPETAKTPAAVSSGRPAAPRSHRVSPAGPGREPKRIIARRPDVRNALPATSTLAFGEPLPTHESFAVPFEQLQQQGLVNHLPPEAVGQWNEARVDEFYQGFDLIQQDLQSMDEERLR